MRASQKEISAAILNAAERLLARLGYQKMTMDDLAEEAQVGRATLYLHFQSKEEIGLACIDRMHYRLLEEIAQAAQGAGTPTERIRLMLRTRVLFAWEQAQGTQQRFEDIFRAIRPLYMERREQYFANEARLFEEVVTAGIQRQEMQADDAPAAAMALVLATNALMPFSLSAHLLTERNEVERRVMTIINLLLDGLRRRVTNT